MNHYKTRALVATAVLGLTAAAGCYGGEALNESHIEASAPREAESAKPALAHDIATVDIAAQRRAMVFLQSVRGTELAPDWTDAVLTGRGRPLYRPDITGPAYYAFAVSAGGFIIVATGDHDYPVAHWSDSGRSPVKRLLEQAPQATKLYKLDTLSYAAEDASGALVAQLGSLPQAYQVAPTENLYGGELYEARWSPQTDDAQQVVGGDLTIRELDPTSASGGDLTGADVGELSGSIVGHRTVHGDQIEEVKPFSHGAELKPLGSWQTIKDSYATAFGVQLDDLRDQVRASWGQPQTPQDVVAPGHAVTIPLLYSGADVVVTGDMASAVRTDIIESDVAQTAVRVSLANPEGDARGAIEVQIHYPDGAAESIALGVDVQVKAGAYDWHYHWADGGQRRYKQIPGFTFNNNTPCNSGCGATAWAMLFGWADYRASVSSKWANHWGLYRSNGGYGSNATAPLYNNGGIRNITMELRHRIKTFCFGPNGATYPGDMLGAWGYLAGRDYSPLFATYNSLGIHDGNVRSAAINVITQQKMPVVIGVGWFDHYPLAYGYAWRFEPGGGFASWFKVNQGWQDHFDWVPAATWFHGQLMYVP